MNMYVQYIHICVFVLTKHVYVPFESSPSSGVSPPNPSLSGHHVTSVPLSLALETVPLSRRSAPVAVGEAPRSDDWRYAKRKKETTINKNESLSHSL